MEPLELISAAEAAFNLYLKLRASLQMTEEEKKAWEAEQLARFEARPASELKTE